MATERPVAGRLDIVAMAMDKLPVDVTVLAAQGSRDNVINFSEVVQREVQSAGSASPLLPLEEPGYSSGQFGVMAKPAGPVNPVAIEGTFVAADLDVPPDGCLGVLEEGRSILGREGPLAGFQAPVFCRHPVTALLRMATFCPA